MNVLRDLPPTKALVLSKRTWITTSNTSKFTTSVCTWKQGTVVVKHANDLLISHEGKPKEMASYVISN